MRCAKNKDADSFESASSVVTVAGGFGGSGDDQSSLGDRGEHRWGDEGGGGDEAEELGHFQNSEIWWSGSPPVSEPLMRPT